MKKIIWSIDPFDKDTKPSLLESRQLMRIAEASSAKVQPIYVLYPSEKGAADIVRIQNALARVTQPGMLEPLIITSSGSDRSAGIRALLNYAKKQDVLWFALSSHGRSGLSRALFGSFAESLLLKAPTPVVFLGQNPSPERPKLKVLFASDFSTRSHRAFRRLLREGKTLFKELVIFHSMRFPMPISSLEAPTYYVPENYFVEQEAWARKKAREWMNEAKTMRIPAKLIIEEAGMGTISGDVILTAAEKESVALIALASSASSIDTALWGSAAYEVLRARELPVWICGPRALASHTAKKVIKKEKRSTAAAVGAKGRR